MNSRKKTIKPNQRKINTIVMLSNEELTFLDKKINKKVTDLASRSAIIRYLVRYSLEHPGILNLKP